MRSVWRLGIPVVPITTGRSQYLDAAMVSGGLKLLRQRLNPNQLDLLWVENVGNLVCPAEFEVGEHHKVALLSVTEGEDKPLKYPLMFRQADVVLITKIDLLPYLPVELEQIRRNIHSINPNASVIPVSALSGEGIDVRHAWLRAARQTPCNLLWPWPEQRSCVLSLLQCHDQTTSKSLIRQFGGGAGCGLLQAFHIHWW